MRSNVVLGYKILRRFPSTGGGRGPGLLNKGVPVFRCDKLCEISFSEGNCTGE